MDPDPKVSVELPLSAWVHLTEVLGRTLAYDLAAPYIAAIGAQVVPTINAMQAVLQSRAAEVAAATPEISARVQ